MSVKKGKMTDNAKPTRTGRPRRTAVPIWRRRSACAVTVVLTAGLMGAGFCSSVLGKVVAARSVS